MRVLRFRYPDQRRGAADAKSKTFRGGSESGVGRQFVPLRIAQPHGAGGATRGCRDRREMTAGALRTEIASQPRGQSPAVVMDPILDRRAGTGLSREGRNRARNRYNTYATCRGRTRYRYRARKDGTRLDGFEPERGCY